MHDCQYDSITFCVKSLFLSMHYLYYGGKTKPKSLTQVNAFEKLMTDCLVVSSYASFSSDDSCFTTMDPKFQTLAIC